MLVPSAAIEAGPGAGLERAALIYCQIARKFGRPFAKACSIVTSRDLSPTGSADDVSAVPEKNVTPRLQREHTARVADPGAVVQVPGRGRVKGDVAGRLQMNLRETNEGGIDIEVQSVRTVARLDSA